MDGAVDAVLRASELPLLEQLLRTPAAWQSAVIDSRAVAGVLELSYREAAACCDAMHAVRGVHTLTLHSKGASDAATDVTAAEAGEPRACAAVASLSTLRTLKLCQDGSSAVDDQVPLALLLALTRLSQLAELELRCENVDLVALAPPLGFLTTLVRLDVSESLVGVEGTGALASALVHLTRLRGLKVGACVLRALAPALGTLPMLTSLEFVVEDEFAIDDDAAETLAPVLQRLSRLVLLKLECIGVDPDGAAALPRPSVTSPRSRF